MLTSCRGKERGREVVKERGGRLGRRREVGRGRRGASWEEQRRWREKERGGEEAARALAAAGRRAEGREGEVGEERSAVG